jgi:hypothetical protein
VGSTFSANAAARFKRRPNLIPGSDSEVFRETYLETVVRAADGLSGDPTEVNGQPLANLVVSTDLLLQLPSARGQIGGVAAIDLNTKVEFRA